MKKTRRRAEEHETSAPPRETVHDEREPDEAARARHATAGGDLMWGDEGIDDPPAQT